MEVVLAKFTNYMDSTVNMPPLKNLTQMRTIINSSKLGTLPFCLIMMWQYQNYSTQTVVYTALHGSYGLIGIQKDIVSPDTSFQKPVSLVGSISIASSQMVYWIPFYFQVSGKSETQNLSDDRMLVSIMLFCIGAVCMMATDVQKTVALAYFKELRMYDEAGYTKRTIDDMYFGSSRNLNFLGEIMMYSAFLVVVGDSRGYLMFPAIWCFILLPNMLKKELSMSKKRQWPVYREQTLFLLPRLIQGNPKSSEFESWVSAFLNYAIYAFIFMGCYVIYCKGGLISIMKG